LGSVGHNWPHLLLKLVIEGVSVARGQSLRIRRVLGVADGDNIAVTLPTGSYEYDVTSKLPPVVQLGEQSLGVITAATRSSLIICLGSWSLIAR